MAHAPALAGPLYLRSLSEAQSRTMSRALALFKMFICSLRTLFDRWRCLVRALRLRYVFVD
jgi:hypothetical protein